MRHIAQKLAVSLLSVGSQFQHSLNSQRRFAQHGKRPVMPLLRLYRARMREA